VAPLLATKAVQQMVQEPVSSRFFLDIGIFQEKSALKQP
jgi:hypothetical protein